MTYQQHLGERDIPLSEPSCFSYSHTLKAFQCLFLFNNDVACTCTWQQHFVVLKNIHMKVCYALYGYCIVVRRSCPNKHLPV